MRILIAVAALLFIVAIRRHRPTVYLFACEPPDDERWVGV